MWGQMGGQMGVHVRVPVSPARGWVSGFTARFRRGCSVSLGWVSGFAGVSGFARIRWDGCPVSPGCPVSRGFAHGFAGKAGLSALALSRYLGVS